MARTKQFMWLVARFCVLGPLAMVVILGQWAEEVFEYLDPLMGEDKEE